MAPTPIEITHINFVSVRPNNGHIGFVSFVYNGIFKLDSIAIYTRLNPTPEQSLYRLVYPLSSKGYPIVHPINKETGEQVEKEVSAFVENLRD